MRIQRLTVGLAAVNFVFLIIVLALLIRPVASQRTWSGVQILGNGSLVKLIKKDGQEQIIQP